MMRTCKTMAKETVKSKGEKKELTSKTPDNNNGNGTYPRKRGRAGRNILLASGALGAIGYGAWQAGRTRFNSKINGNLQLNGLKASVEVVRDKWGVPHLYAS